MVRVVAHLEDISQACGGDRRVYLGEGDDWRGGPRVAVGEEVWRILDHGSAGDGSRAELLKDSRALLQLHLEIGVYHDNGGYRTHGAATADGHKYEAASADADSGRHERRCYEGSP